MKKFAVTILAVLMLAAFAIPASAYNLGAADDTDGWRYLWFSDGADDVSTNLTLEMLQAATHLVVELSEEPENNVQFIYFGSGNGWRWTDPVVFGPEQGTTINIDLKALAGWDDAVSGGGGDEEAAKIGFGSDGLAEIITSATLVMGGGGGGGGAVAPTPRDEDGGAKAGVGDVAVASAIALAAAGAVVLSRKRK
ncbi:MAG: hypothetical protein LBC86_10900 [Oscillospiraceae bacterium]|nr:hypothetical protein [Oscillospiraceae bacterium]